MIAKWCVVGVAALLLFLMATIFVLAAASWVDIAVPSLDRGTVPAGTRVEYVITAYTLSAWTEMVVYLREVNSNITMQSHIDDATTGWQQWRRIMVVGPGEYELSIVGKIGGARFTDHVYFQAE